MADDEVTITLPREDWKALLATIPMSAMTYTTNGVDIFNAYHVIEQAVDPEKAEPAELPRSGGLHL